MNRHRATLWHEMGESFSVLVLGSVVECRFRKNTDMYITSYVAGLTGKAKTLGLLPVT